MDIDRPLAIPDDRHPFDIAILGGGNMGAALLGGMLASGHHRVVDVAVVEIDAARRAEVADAHPGLTVVEQCPPCRSAVLAVKPPDTPAAAATAVAAGAVRLLSLAAGVTLASIERAVGDRSSSVAIIRAMPNTPALVGRGAAAIAPHAGADRDDVAWAAEILESVGSVVEIDEADMLTFTAVIGSGPAYLFLVAEALIDAAVAEGLEPDVARRSVTQLLVGSGLLLDAQGDAAELRRRVTSPGGTTEAGLGELERHSLRAAFADAVRAAVRRGAELDSP